MGSDRVETFSSTAARSCLTFFERIVEAGNRKEAAIFRNIAIASILVHVTVLAYMAIFKKDVLPPVIHEIALEFVTPSTENGTASSSWSKDAWPLSNQGIGKDNEEGSSMAMVAEQKTPVA